MMENNFCYSVMYFKNCEPASMAIQIIAFEISCSVACLAAAIKERCASARLLIQIMVLPAREVCSSLFLALIPAFHHFLVPKCLCKRDNPKQMMALRDIRYQASQQLVD